MVISFDRFRAWRQTPLPVATDFSWSKAEVEFFPHLDTLGNIVSILAKANFSGTTEDKQLVPSSCVRKVVHGPCGE